MYQISLTEIYSLGSCRTEYQVGDTYDAWSKIACSALNTRQISSSPCCVSYGIGEVYPEAARFFEQLRNAVGAEDYDMVTDINDDESGRFGENHERALKLAVQLILEAGLVTLVPEEGELVAELRRRIGDIHTDRV